MGKIQKFVKLVSDDFFQLEPHDNLLLIYHEETERIAKELIKYASKKCQVHAFKRSSEERKSLPMDVIRSIEYIKKQEKGAKFFFYMGPEKKDDYMIILYDRYLFTKKDFFEGFNARGFNESMIDYSMVSVDALRKYSEPLKKILDGENKSITITTKKGNRTGKLFFGISTKDATELLPSIRKYHGTGYWTNIPFGAVNIQPDLGTATGTFFVNLFPYKGIELEFEAGRIKNIKGPKALVSEYIKNTKVDSGKAEICELVFGINKKSPLVDNIIPLEKHFGVVGIAVGTNNFWKNYDNVGDPANKRRTGDIEEGVHTDTLSKNAKVEITIDGEKHTLLENMKFNPALMKRFS